MTNNVAKADYDLSPEDLEHVFKTIDIPTCPAIVTEVMAEAQKDDPDIKKLAKTIAKDVGMAALAIKLANSPLFRTSKAVSDVPTALARLGIRNIVCVVVAVALRASMTGLSAAWVEKFWNHAAVVATAAGLIARKQYGISPDAAYTYALFHDSAIPLLMRRFDNYTQVVELSRERGQLLIDAENEFFPCTHPIVGSLLVRNWGLPPILGQAIRFHHEADVYDLHDKALPGGALSLIAVTHVAERLTSESPDGVDLEVSDNHYDRALEYLGISECELEDIAEKLEE